MACYTMEYSRSSMDFCPVDADSFSNKPPNDGILGDEFWDSLLLVNFSETSNANMYDNGTIRPNLFMNQNKNAKEPLTFNSRGPCWHNFTQKRCSGLNKCW